MSCLLHTTDAEALPIWLAHPHYLFDLTPTLPSSAHPHSGPGFTAFSECSRPHWCLRVLALAVPSAYMHFLPVISRVYSLLTGIL